MTEVSRGVTACCSVLSIPVREAPVVADFDETISLLTCAGTEGTSSDSHCARDSTYLFSSDNLTRWSGRLQGTQSASTVTFDLLGSVEGRRTEKAGSTLIGFVRAHRFQLISIIPITFASKPLEAIAMLKTAVRLHRYGHLARSRSCRPRIEWMESRIVLSPPTVTALSPTSGTAAGGTPVTISGTSFTGATVVDFGTTAATHLDVVSDSEITADSPAGTGAVDVTVTTPQGTSATSSADMFTYTAVTAAGRHCTQPDQRNGGWRHPGDDHWQRIHWRDGGRLRHHRGD